MEEKGRGEEGGPFFPRQKRGEESEKGAILSTVRGSLTRARRGEGERRSSLSFKKRRRGKTLLFVPVLFIPRGKNEDERKQERLEIGVARSPNDRPFSLLFLSQKKERGNADTRLFFCLRIQKHMINEPRTAAAREAEKKKKSPPPAAKVSLFLRRLLFLRDFLCESPVSLSLSLPLVLCRCVAVWGAASALREREGEEGDFLLLLLLGGIHQV